MNIWKERYLQATKACAEMCAEHENLDLPIGEMMALTGNFVVKCELCEQHFFNSFDGMMLPEHIFTVEKDDDVKDVCFECYKDFE